MKSWIRRLDSLSIVFDCDRCPLVSGPIAPKRHFPFRDIGVRYPKMNIYLGLSIRSNRYIQIKEAKIEIHHKYPRYKICDDRESDIL
jgi:hypothetical protein